MKCKTKMASGARLIAVLAAVVLCSLCVCFISCNEEADESSDGTTCTAQSDGTYLCISGSKVYAITVSGSDGSYSYSYEASEYFGTSDTDYDGFVTLLSSLSDGCTIVLSPDLSSTQLGYFAEALMDSSLSGVTVDMSYMTITAIKPKTFYECKNINSVILPPCVTQIPDYAFYECTNLESVTISSAITSIGDTAFYDCIALETVTIGSAVTTISSYSSSSGGAFGNCSAITKVYYNGTKDEWGKISIEDTDSEEGNYYLTQASIICSDGTYTY